MTTATATAARARPRAVTDLEFDQAVATAKAISAGDPWPEAELGRITAQADWALRIIARRIDDTPLLFRAPLVRVICREIGLPVPGEPIARDKADVLEV